MLLNRKNEISKIKTLLLWAKDNPNINSGLVIGSYAKGLSSQDSDVDILLLYENEQCISNFLEKFKEFNKYENIYIYDKISICFKNETDFLSEIASILNGQKIKSTIQSWVIGGEISEVLLCDLVNAIIVFDKTIKISRTINKLKNEYPKEYSIIAKNELLTAIKIKAMLVKKHFEKNENILAEIGFYEIIVLLSRTFCINKKIFNPGLKHLLNSEKYSFEEDYQLKNIKSKYEFINELIKRTENIK